MLAFIINCYFHMYNNNTDLYYICRHPRALFLILLILIMTVENKYSTTLLHDGPAFSKPTVDKIEPLQFTLKNADIKATAFPIFKQSQLPKKLLTLMKNEFNKEIENGDTYPQLEQLSDDEFAHYWLHSFCVVALKTDKLDLDELDVDGQDWEDLFLGTFYIKPNYMPRCSHNCNAGFLINSEKRGLKIGYRLGQIYLQWAPLLGYTYSVFNLVFVTNVGSWKIWDRLKFDRIGLVPKAAILKGHDEPVDAIIYGKDLTNIEPELLEDFA
ncbi:uncharacterized protein NDAI_0E01220 [Naumovozyma dairenensis CBS 421]|uniref:N-acetyltransferase domain-containing protein n=1 Tax=Naumovozyma dairenensis (strain ATCC 10597 / BCRC 20456 / CBS 421 / NBRC 0211 / NRRL Y-12639) TaxID=1071378 RepID=G0WB18_NAUDC|nr:hypothetical protein NDAI_0E01220 [Naumovozyma dairenensis CBS 421]CCD24938.1 hypothetical protein NDAI_0E01220 [Naumovozyma dairenensis CBS 421]